MAGFNNDILGSNFPRTGKDFISGAAGNVGAQTSPIFSTKPTARFISGARCILRMNGGLIGFAFSISWSINTIQDEIMTIDDYLPYEYAPNRIIVDGSIGMFHIPGQSPSAEFIQSNVLSFMFHKYIQIEVRDVATDQLLFYAPKAVITSRVEDVRTENLSSINLTFKSIGFQDERTPKFPDNTGEKLKAGSNLSPREKSLNKDYTYNTTSPVVQANLNTESRLA